MKASNSILCNLNEASRDDWYYLCNDAEQALFAVKNECKDERAIKALERMILELNNIRMEQYNALNEYSLVEREDFVATEEEEAELKARAEKYKAYNEYKRSHPEEGNLDPYSQSDEVFNEINRLYGVSKEELLDDYENGSDAYADWVSGAKMSLWNKRNS